MKRYLLVLSAVIALSACEVIEPQDAPTMNKKNVSVFCENVFTDNVKAAVESFCKVYYVSRFLVASPEEKVSSKYDDIRTRLVKNTDSYSFGDMGINFSQNSPFIIGGVWTVKHNYRHKDIMTMRSENEWKIHKMNEGSTVATILITVLSADDSGMKLNAKVKGSWEEESSYSADYSSESIDVEIVNKTPIAISTSSYSGMIGFDFYENDAMILECDMTLRPGTTSVYDVH